MPSDLPIRPVAPEEFEALARVTEHAFASGPEPDDVSAAERQLMEFDRTLAMFDGDDAVGAAAAYSFEMTVPGGAPVPTAGVTWVGVLPTHRRRGALRALMRRQLDDIRERGQEPIAALWASESPIYGRFGYGLASTSVSVKVPRSHNRLRDVAGAADLRVRLVDGEKSLDAVQPVYDAAVRRRPGMLRYPNDTWRRARLLDPENRRDGGSPLRTVVAEDDAGEVRAYARYATKPEWSAAGAAGTTVVRELEWRDPAGAAVLWRYLLDFDLMSTLHARNRPVDDPLLQLLMDPRRAQPSTSDALYVRIVDLPTAMTARRYAVPLDVVLDVTDDFCDWNAGRWRLTASGDDVRCERSEDDADLAIGARDLGACYLGGTSLRALADAGLVGEHTAGSVDALSRALRHEPAPWCPFVF